MRSARVLPRGFWLLFAALFVLQCSCSSDDFADSVDYSFWKDHHPFYSNASVYLVNQEFVVPQAMADSLLAAGRLAGNKSMVCDSVALFKRSKAGSLEEKAIIYETIASLGCGSFRPYYYWRASRIWKKLNNVFRSRLDLSLAFGRPPSIIFEQYAAQGEAKKYDAQKIIVGATTINITERDLLLSQSDRVSRDWFGFQLNDSPFSDSLLTAFSERLTYSPEELTSLGWHEGGRISEIIGINRKIATGTIIAEYDGTWYAPDEFGVFRFSVPLDKALYPTNRFFADNIMMVVDTHGVNMVVEQAIRYNATVVVGCCDYFGKVDAARYLADRNIKVVCFTDRFLPLLLGLDLPIVGSPPIRRTENGFAIGGQVVEILSDEIVVVQGVANYSLVPQYYDTPERYFSRLQNMTGMRAIYYEMSSPGQIHSLLDFADQVNSSVVAVRVFGLDDYLAVSSWLGKNKKNRAMLFHSAAYPHGYRLFFEFPGQTSFDDINPIFV